MKSIKIILIIGLFASWQINLLNSQIRNFYVEGNGNQFGVIHSTNNNDSGLELIRGSQFSGTDWRLVNDGGVFKIFDALDNFNTNGDENLRIGNSGTLSLLEGTEASLGNGSGVLVLGNSSGANLALDKNEILARNGANAAPLFIQPGANAGSTYLNITDGNVGVGGFFAPVKLTITNGTDVTSTSGGYLLMGSTGGENIGMDNNEILARNGSNASTLYLQHGSSAGNVAIGASSGEANRKLTVQDNSWQIKITNTNDLTNDWLIGASEPGWVAGANKLVFDDDGSSNNPILMLDGAAEAVAIGIETIPAGYKLAVDGRTICEEVMVELSEGWPDYVFAHDYPLPSLASLEAQINQLGHLPGVPSAAQLEEEGLELGNMQRIMMQKIEELTLYVIQLKKENEQIKSELEELKH